jgi:hypothetical protein
MDAEKVCAKQTCPIIANAHKESTKVKMRFEVTAILFLLEGNIGGLVRLDEWASSLHALVHRREIRLRNEGSSLALKGGNGQEKTLFCFDF